MHRRGASSATSTLTTITSIKKLQESETEDSRQKLEDAKFSRVQMQIVECGMKVWKLKSATATGLGLKIQQEFNRLNDYQREFTRLLRSQVEEVGEKGAVKQDDAEISEHCECQLLRRFQDQHAVETFFGQPEYSRTGYPSHCQCLSGSSV